MYSDFSSHWSLLQFDYLLCYNDRNRSCCHCKEIQMPVQTSKEKVKTVLKRHSKIISRKKLNHEKGKWKNTSLSALSLDNLNENSERNSGQSILFCGSFSINVIAKRIRYSSWVKSFVIIFQGLCSLVFLWQIFFAQKPVSRVSCII